VKDLYKKNYFEVIDNIIGEIDNRFNYESANPICFMYNLIFDENMNYNQAEIEADLSIYENDIDSNQLN
jgi:hypothetical protein